MAGVTIVDSATAEISRCFVRAGHRGRSIGRALVARAVDHASASGASRVVLDTFPERMAPAVRLYQSLGFAMAQVRRLPGIEPALVRMVLPLD